MDVGLAVAEWKKGVWGEEKYCGGDFLCWIRPRLSQSTQHLWSLLCDSVFVLQVIQHIHRGVWCSPVDTCLTFSTLHAASHTHALPSLCVDSVFTQTALWGHAHGCYVWILWGVLVDGRRSEEKQHKLNLDLFRDWSGLKKSSKVKLWLIPRLKWSEEK